MGAVFRRLGPRVKVPGGGGARTAWERPDGKNILPPKRASCAAITKGAHRPECKSGIPPFNGMDVPPRRLRRAVSFVVAALQRGDLRRRFLSLPGLMIASLGWRTSYLIIGAAMAALSLLIVLRFRPPTENAPMPASVAAAGGGSLPPEALVSGTDLSAAARRLRAVRLHDGERRAFHSLCPTCGFNLIGGSAAYGIRARRSLFLAGAGKARRGGVSLYRQSASASLAVALPGGSARCWDSCGPQPESQIT